MGQLRGNDNDDKHCRVSLVEGLARAQVVIYRFLIRMLLFDPTPGRVVSVLNEVAMVRFFFYFAYFRFPFPSSYSILIFMYRPSMLQNI
jgi:hypothetical protein